MDPNTVYVIDPAREKGLISNDNMPSKECTAYAFLATWPKKIQYDDWTARRVFMDMWTPLELLAARHVMAPPSTDVQIVRESFVKAGLAPRYVFNADIFDQRWKSLLETTENLTSKVLQTMLTTKLAKISESTVSSAVLAYTRLPQSEMEDGTKPTEPKNFELYDSS